MRCVARISLASFSALTLAACATAALPAEDGQSIRLSLQTRQNAGSASVSDVTAIELPTERSVGDAPECDPNRIRSAAGLRQIDVFNLGDLSARECAVARLEVSSEGTGGSSGYAAVRADVQRLHGFYNRRAQRQQTFMDLGSSIAVVGSVGALEGGLSPTTQRAWALAAFAPALFGQINAFEPTRELFHGGALAVQLITLRYDRYRRALTLLGEVGDSLDCRPYEDAHAAVVEWRAVPANAAIDRSGHLLSEALRLVTTCRDLAQKTGQLQFTADYARRLEPFLASEYAADVLLLDHALVAKDRELRHSPSETLSTLVASPLRAADLLLTGQNAKAAIDSLRTQVAFTGLNRNLSTIDLPQLPSVMEEVVPLRDEALAMMRATPPSQAAAHVSSLRDLAGRLQERQRQQAFALRLAAGLANAAASDHLTFGYDAATNTTTVAIGPRQQANALATSSTGSGRPSGS